MTIADAGPVGPTEPSQRAMEEAAEWFALLRGEPSGSDRRRWAAWLDADPEHGRAWGYVEAVGRQVASLRALPDPQHAADGLWTARERVVRRRRGLLAGLVAMSGGGLLGWRLWQDSPLARHWALWAADERTRVGEVRETMLSEGSRLWLNTATAIDVDIGRSLRRVRLIAGEILVQTAAGAGRPFVVDTTHGRLRALGTRFTVRLLGSQTLVAVYQGAVQIRTRDGSEAVVGPGEQRCFDAGAVTGVEAADLSREAWSRGMLVARDIRLAQVVDELRRYRTAPIDVAESVADLRVLGNFPLRDPDETLAMLASVLPIRVRREARGGVMLEAKTARR